MDVKRLWQKLMCKLSMHRQLDVIQSYGAAQHIGCPYCRREFGIHHGMEAVIPWDAEVADLYRFMGYDVDAPSERWRRYVREHFPA